MSGSTRQNQLAFIAGFRAEWIQLFRASGFLVLVTIQAISFLLLVSLFALTGSRAPLAVICSDTGPYGLAFVNALSSTHHSFDIHQMSSNSANNALHAGTVVAILHVPPDFSESVLFGKTISIRVDVDNIDTDMTEDIQRALPSAIVRFGRQLRLPNIRAHVEEHDLIDHDTGFIPYLVVSGLVLDAFVLSALLSAMAVAHEFEVKTVRYLIVSPINPLVPLTGRAAAAAIASVCTLLLPVSIVLLGFKVRPLHPVEALSNLIACTAIFSSVGVALGALVKRTVPLTALIVGISLPLYLCSGSLEPARLDGPRVWFVAHFSPVYYAVGIMEKAFHGFSVTPESTSVNAIALVGWAVGAIALARYIVKRQLP